ncbi:MAG: DUF721 domain-containing protein [Actinobacteria bacterium]|nr:DUF721 domain-containing protein [Actinomycetota bacterium]
MPIEPLPEDRETLQTLGRSLDHLRRTLGLARPDTVRILTDSWQHLMGADLAAVSRLHSLRGTTLVVAVEDPAVAEHLRWQRSELVGAANALCGCDAVTDVEIRIAPRG